MNDRVEERLGGTLERRAGAVAAGPRFSAEDIVHAGRSAARRRTLRIRISVAATAGLTALAVVAVPAMTDALRRRAEPAPATSTSRTPPRSLPTSCPVERLPVPPHSVMDMVINMDPTGRYIVGRTNPGGKVGRLDMLIWDNGHLQVVRVPGDQQLPTDINARGVAVGVSGDIGQQAWMYRDGTVTNLPGMRPTVANAINDEGVVVGWDTRRRPVVWRSPSEQPVALPTPSGVWEGEATDIAADGTIVGMLDKQGANMPRAYAWLPNGALRQLPLPVIAGERAVSSRAMAIVGDWVAGMADSPRGDTPTLWNLRTGEVRAFPELSIGGRSVSADGWLVGNQEEGRALLASLQDELTLPDLDNHKSSLANIAVAISQDGRLIAGDGSAGGKLPVPVVWRCR
ncbi:hypothetical protein ONA70_07295 [Micromonospora yasonensis]|uniref:hypothetical protein n=1 Tax=Micromonospora yasonensis TaxID=1128667 RepID=UPI00222FC6A8|nr:hypothetical protein [Micromonospora yasonensis]MCW3839901.1 hypothetical protein [Micromonospora yasonensis]